ncbi:MAG TPA: tripartite tricarboxylate transporter substrate-binding protein [Ramlibacter sp.]|nr:tripartite tricarboxylate transporter substrate-binding protein [Ramlibacter sp.]
MAMHRRLLLGGLGASLAAPALLAQPQGYPNRAVRIIVPFPPGALTDTLGRLTARHLQAALGQSFVVENVAGANSQLGSSRVAKAPADGYTLLVSATHFVAVPAVTAKLPYDPAKDFTPIALLANTPLVLLVHPSVPVRSPAEFVTYARAQAGGLSYGSSGIGSSIHFAGSMFASATGAPLVHVPYQGAAQSVTDAVGGTIPALFLDIGAGASLAAAGKLRAIGVTSAERSPVLPDVPSLADVAPGFNIGAWYGLYGPAGLPQPIVDLLNRHATEAMNSPDNADTLIRKGNVPGKLDARRFAQYVDTELQKWARIAREANIRAE